MGQRSSAPSQQPDLHAAARRASNRSHPLSQAVAHTWPLRALRGREAITFALAAGLLVLWTVVSIHLMRNDPVTTLRQYGSFWASGWAANHGLDPYGAYPSVPPIFVPGLQPAGTPAGLRDINLNPPALLPLFQALALTDPHVLVEAWVALAAAIFVAGTFVLMRQAPRAIAPWQILCWLLMTPVRDTIWQAQVYGLVFLCAAVGWVALKRQNRALAAAAIGTLAAMKPNFLLWPVFLFLAGHRRVGASAAAVFAGWCALPVLLDGPGVYGAWLRVVRRDPHWVFTTDISLAGLLHRAGAAWLGRVLSLGLIAGTAFIVWRRRGNALTTSLTALAVGIVAAPLAWGYYAIVLAPALIDGMWGRLGVLAALLLMVPVRVALGTMSGPAWEQSLGTLIPLLPVLLVLAASLRAPARS